MAFDGLFLDRMGQGGALVSQGMVAVPPVRAGEGRYLRSVQLF